ncbi:hypothetical protein [Asaia platycodi]|uniref:hypothetical protein n=1 Tax=Asaia platycodi TaxID=610243 RepID=UPI00046F29FD|nr:hypothetical protein [Asaia platycodi]
MSDSFLWLGGQARIQSGGTASQLRVIGNGWWGMGAGAVLVGSGGTAFNTVLSGAYQAVQGQGAYTENTVVTNSGWQDVGLNSFDGLYGGGVASGSTLVSGGKQFVSGGTAVTTIISAGGTQTAMLGGVASGSVVSSAGFMTVLSGGTAYGANAVSGGRVLIAGGGVLSGGIIASGATLSGSAGALWTGNIKVGVAVSGGSIVSQGITEILSGGVHAISSLHREALCKSMPGVHSLGWQTLQQAVTRRWMGLLEEPSILADRGSVSDPHGNDKPEFDYIRL